MRESTMISGEVQALNTEPVGSSMSERVSERQREIDYHMRDIENTPKQQLLINHRIEIRPLSLGCVVTVGCKEIAFSSMSEALAEVNQYFEDPHKAYLKWYRQLV